MRGAGPRVLTGTLKRHDFDLRGHPCLGSDGRLHRPAVKSIYSAWMLLSLMALA